MSAPHNEGVQDAPDVNAAAPITTEAVNGADDNKSKPSIVPNEAERKPTTVGEFDLGKFVEPELIDDVDEAKAREYRRRAEAWAKARAERDGVVLLQGFRFRGDGIGPAVQAVVAAGADPNVSKVTVPGLASCYYAINPSRVPLSLKTSKHHVNEVWRFGVDLDVETHPDTPEQLDQLADDPALAERLWQHQLEGRRAIVRVIDEYVRRHGKPTTCVDSGGGFQPLFDLDQPVVLPPSPASFNEDGEMLDAEGKPTKLPSKCVSTPEREKVIEDIEARNRGLFERFNAIIAELGVGHLVKIDGTQDVCRIFRTPWTANRPAVDKKLKARKPAWARLVYEDPAVTYPLSSFPVSTQPAKGKASSRGGSAPVQVDMGNVKRIGRDALETDPVLSKVESRAKVAIVQGLDPEQPLTGGNTRSDWVWHVACAMVRAGVDDTTMYSILTDPDLGISEHIRAQGNAAAVDRAARRTIERAKAQDGPHVFDGDWMAAAEVFVRQRFPHLVHMNDDFYVYRGPQYVMVEDATVKSEAWAFLRGCIVMENKGTKAEPKWEPEAMRPAPNSVAALVDATKAVAHRPADTYTPPCWIAREADDPDPMDLLAVRNGLLRVSTGEMMDPTPRFFTLNCSDVAFDPKATCPVWEQTLKEVFDGDSRTALLQQVMGYLLTADTAQQKMFLFVGPPRSTKGTVMRVVKQLVGPANYGTLMPNHLNNSTFSLQPLIGRTVAAIPDLRLGNKYDASLVQVLLNISGEDDIPIDRKNKLHWIGKLSARVVAAANDLPTFRENSAALANRFVVVRFTKSYLNREDLDLGNKLAAEMSGILNWALDGLRSLRRTGRFDLPDSAKQAVLEMFGAGNTIAQFVMERCELGADKQVSNDHLRAAYQRWCVVQDLKSESPVWFGRKLGAAFPDLKLGQKVSVNGQRVDGVHGLEVKPETVGVDVQCPDSEETPPHDEVAEDEPF